MRNRKSFFCVCCQSDQDPDTSIPVRVGKRIVCGECASNSILVTKEDAKTLGEILQCEIVMTKDHIRCDRRFLSKGQLGAAKKHVVWLRRLVEQCRRVMRRK